MSAAPSLHASCLSRRTTARMSRNPPLAFRLRELTDSELEGLRVRALGFVVSFEVAEDGKVQTRQLLRSVLIEQRVRRSIASLPNASEMMDIHQRSDRTLLDDGRKLLARFRASYAMPGPLSESARTGCRRQLSMLRREWATRHPGDDLAGVLSAR